MPIAGPTRTPNDVRSIEIGVLIIGLGAILLIVSLFLEWYQPGIDAWEIFEVWDLVLAALALVALAAVAGRMGFAAPRPASWLIGPALAALVIVLYNLVDPPPLTANSIDGDPGPGLWLALADAVLMTAGALLSVARISIAIDPTAAFGGRDDPAAPRRPAGRFGRPGSGPVAGGPIDPIDPIEPGPGGAGPGAPPTEPTRRL